MDRKRRLDDQRQQRGDDNRPGAKLVHLNVRFAYTEIERAIHRLAAGRALAAPGAEGSVLSGSPSSRISRGCSDKRTITSSKRSRLAAGLMRMCLKGLPGLISI